jgi:hypothetical protein
LAGGKGNISRVGMPVNPLLPESSIGTTIRIKRVRCTPYAAWKRRQHMSEHCNVQSESVIDAQTGGVKTVTRKESNALLYRGPPAVFYQQRWAYPYHERHLQQQFKELSMLLLKHGITSTAIQEETKKSYVQLKSVVIARGQNVQGTLAACLYTACKDLGSPRSIREIALMFGIKQSNITYGIKLIRHALKDVHSPVQRDVSYPVEYIDRYALDVFKHHYTQLAIPFDAQVVHESACYQWFTDLAKYALAKIDLYGIMDDNTAPSIAASVLYFVTQSPCFLPHYPKDQPMFHKRTIAKACVTSDVTISKCFKKLSSYHSLITPASC